MTDKTGDRSRRQETEAVDKRVAGVIFQASKLVNFALSLLFSEFLITFLPLENSNEDREGFSSLSILEQTADWTAFLFF